MSRSSTSRGEALPSEASEQDGRDKATETQHTTLTGKKSPGVLRIEAMTSVITTTDRVFLFTSMFLLAYVYRLDSNLRRVYQPYATASFGQHSLLTTIGVLRGVIAAAAQPVAAKIADVFGRLEPICISIVFYVVGSVVEATSHSVEAFCAGAVLYQVGFTMIIFLIAILISDITSTRSRLLFHYVPAIPILLNTWLSGNIANAVMDSTGWRWGLGMFAIIYPVTALPLIIHLYLIGRRAQKAGVMDNVRSPFQQLGAWELTKALFWQLDIIGILLILSVLGLILTPLTIAGGVETVNGASRTWSQAHIIAPIVVGFACIPAFIFWELRALHPIVPFRQMKDRAIWGAYGIAILLNFTSGMQSDYLYTVLVVAFDFSITNATRINSLYFFVSVISGGLLGVLVFYVKRLKYFIVAGACLFMVSFGLLIHYRGATSSQSKAGIIGAQALIGFAGGLLPYPTQAILQVYLKHEHLAVMTALYLAIYNVGDALGSCVSGAIWTQVLPTILHNDLAFQSNTTLWESVYGDPFTAARRYRVGTEVRTGIISSYRQIQKLLCITGLCLCLPLLAFALVLRNPKLNDKQTLNEEDNQEYMVKDDSQERGRSSVKVGSSIETKSSA